MMIQNYRKLLKILTIAACGLTVIACGGRSAVVTKDDSAEYRDAKTLPPLKKPDLAIERTPVVKNAEEPQTPDVNAVSTVARPAGPVPVKVSAAGEVNASVVESKKGEVHLRLEGDSETTWNFMRRNLRSSDITVHSRNKEAGTFSIGCDGTEESDAAEESKKGRWLVFGSSKKDDFEYCTLELVQKKSSAKVSAYDRHGELISAKLAQAFFARLLNN